MYAAPERETPFSQVESRARIPQRRILKRAPARQACNCDPEQLPLGTDSHLLCSSPGGLPRSNLPPRKRRSGGTMPGPARHFCTRSIAECSPGRTICPHPRSVRRSLPIAVHFLWRTVFVGHLSRRRQRLNVTRPSLSRRAARNWSSSLATAILPAGDREDCDKRTKNTQPRLKTFRQPARKWHEGPCPKRNWTQEASTLSRQSRCCVGAGPGAGIAAKPGGARGAFRFPALRGSDSAL